MSTDERERLERLVEAVLHRDDDQPVDVPGARAELVHQLDRHRRIQRLAVAAVAASVLAVVVATSLVLGLRDETRSLPLPVTRVTLAPSGLPVGLLEGKVTRSAGDVDVSTFRLWVHDDGTGALSLGGGIGGSFDRTGGGYPVDIVRLGPGRAALSYAGTICGSDRALTFRFIVQGHTVTVLDAQSPGCLVSEGITTDLPGTELHVSPLPAVG
jgi:hypothetical protein